MQRILKVIRRNPVLWWLARKLRHAVLQSHRHLQSFRPYRLLARNATWGFITYRAATVEDAPVLSGFYGYENYIRQGDSVEACIRELKDLQDKGCILIAYIRGKPVGAAVIRQFPENDFYPDWWIFRMQVETKYRGLGIGRGLMRRALKEAEAQGADRISFLVPEVNRLVVNMCRKMGFKQISIPRLDDQLKKVAQRGGNRRIIMSVRIGQR
jgi:GNAT superfamily N-acetyltransferase